MELKSGVDGSDSG